MIQEIGELPKGAPESRSIYHPNGCRSQDDTFGFGADYPTADGSCVWITFMSWIWQKHMLRHCSASYQWKPNPYEVFNLGTGKGSSVLEVIKAFWKGNRAKINYQIVDRRPGDVVAVYADTKKALEVMGWHTSEAWKCPCFCLEVGSVRSRNLSRF